MKELHEDQEEHSLYSLFPSVAFAVLNAYYLSMNIVEIDSLDRPELGPYRTLRRPLKHEREGIFVAEGTRVVLRLLKSQLEILSLLLTPEWLRQTQSALLQRPESPTVFVAPKPVLDTIVGFNLHQGIMAVVRIPPPSTLEEVLARSPAPYLLAAVDGLTNAENLGALVRNCSAFGVQAILVGETSSSPYLRRAVRNSMGSVFSLPVVHLENLAGTIRSMKERHGIRTIAAHPHAAQGLADATLTGSCCLVFGNEGDGVSKEILDAADEAVEIPMANGVDSINVASASAVFLFEAVRQREGAH